MRFPVLKSKLLVYTLMNFLCNVLSVWSTFTLKTWKDFLFSFAHSIELVVLFPSPSMRTKDPLNILSTTSESQCMGSNQNIEPTLTPVSIPIKWNFDKTGTYEYIDSSIKFRFNIICVNLQTIHHRNCSVQLFLKKCLYRMQLFFFD